MGKFEVGKFYKGYHGQEKKCTKRTENSVWLDGYRFNIKTDNEGNEYTTAIVRVTDFKASKE